MEEVFVRPAAAEDAGAVSLLNLTSLGLRYAADKTKERLEEILARPNHRLLVAVDGARVVGYLHGDLSEMTFTPTMAEVICLAVHTDSRGRGVGRKLMAAFEQWARAQGAVGIQLMSGFEREAGHRFYGAVGYAHTRDCKEFYRSLEGEATV